MISEHIYQNFKVYILENYIISIFGLITGLKEIIISFKMNVSDNLNIQNVIGDLKKSLQDKRSELSQFEASISDFERQLQILDISLKEKIETNMILTTRLAGFFSSLETVEKKRDNEMRFHSNLLRKLQICEDIEKELRSKMHKETLNRLNNHVGIFNQMTERSKISVHLGKGGEFTGTKEDIDEGLYNYVYPPYLLTGSTIRN